MPLRQTRRARAPARRRRLMRFMRRQRRLPRGIYNPQPTFTETLDFGRIVPTFDPATNSASALGVWQIAPNSLPQIAQYQALYNQIKIRKVKLLIVPNYNFESQAGGLGTATNPAVTLTRLAYAINDTSALTPPTSEIDVLSDNGCKIRMMSKPVSITFRPTPQLAEGLVSGGFVAVNRKNVWITMNAGGITTLHGGVSYSFYQDYSVSNTCVMFNVYAKVTFSLRDPK